MRFLTVDGRETGRTKISQNEEEDPYTQKMKTQKDEGIPELLVFEFMLHVLNYQLKFKLNIENMMRYNQ